MTLPELTNGTMAYALYPYESHRVEVIFVYGDDSTREMKRISNIPVQIQILASLIGLFVILAAILLCIIRKKLNLRHHSILSTFIDVMITFTSGGNLQMRHKIERWFFGISLVGAFFISSLFTGDLLDCVYQVLHQRIDSLEQLARTDAPIYVSVTIRSEDLKEALRYLVVRY